MLTLKKLHDNMKFIALASFLSFVCLFVTAATKAANNKYFIYLYIIDSSTY